MSTQITTRRPAVPLLTYVVGGELALSLIGGALAVAFHINTFADAFGNKSEMAMPWEPLLVMALGGLAVARWRGWRGVTGALAAGVPLLLALLSTGDSETFKPGLPTWVYIYQVIVIAASAAGLIPVVTYLFSLRRRVPETA